MSIAFFIYIKDFYILHNAHFYILEKFRFLIILTYSNKNKEIKFLSLSTDLLYMELSTFLPHKKAAKNAIARTLY